MIFHTDSRYYFLYSWKRTAFSKFIASGIIDKIEDIKDTTDDPNQELKQILFNVKFKDIKKFKKIIGIKKHIKNLSFIEKTSSCSKCSFSGKSKNNGLITGSPSL